MRKLWENLLWLLSGGVGKTIRERNNLRSRLAAAQPAPQLQNILKSYRDYIETQAIVIQYRQAYFEARGRVVSDTGIPIARAWPQEDNGISYQDKLLGILEISNGKGAEIGPLCVPMVSKNKSRVLYVDHLDTDELRKKYSTIEGIVEIDRPMVNDSLRDTLQNDAPLDYFVASQVLEHVPNPIRWLREIADVLRPQGRLALSLPDRQFTFDFLREETQAADIVSAYLENAKIPNIRCVYDHFSLASYISMPEGDLKTVFPHDIVSARGAIKPKVVMEQHMPFVLRAKAGEYLDVHAWVFTPPSFLLVMAQLAGDGLLPFRMRQFYPTNPKSLDRGSSSFTTILEKVSGDVPVSEIRRSYLDALGE